MKYLPRLIIIIVIVYFLSWIFYAGFENGYKKYYRHQSERMHELFEESEKYDVLFLGSSRVHLHLNPRIFDSITGLRSYNGGMEGANINEFKTVLQAYLLVHPAPLAVILNAEPSSFVLQRNFFRPSDYLACLSNEEIAKSMASSGFPVKLYKIFPQFKFSQFDDYEKINALKGLCGKKEIQDETYKGYLCNGTDSIINAVPDKEKNEFVIKDSAVEAFRSIVNICRQNKIKLIVTHGPEYMRMNEQRHPNYEAAVGLILSLCKAYKVPYLRHDDIAICHRKKYFRNVGHLNKYGADFYTEYLSRELINSAYLPLKK
jgi:hypothetical protein